MSDSSLPDTPTPPWGLQLGNNRPDYGQAVERLRSRLLTIALSAVALVVVVAAAGVVVAILEPSWALDISVSAVAGCVVVVLAAAGWAASVVRTFRPVPWAGGPAAPTAPAAPAAPPTTVTPPAPVAPEPIAAPAPAAFEAVQTTSGEDPGKRREVFVKLARRLQSLVNRAIRKIDGLEREIEDPEILKGLYEIDHLVTRVRRQAENLAVLGGEAPQRRSNKPVSVYAVLRSAVAEVEHYKQVTIVPTDDVDLHGHAVTEVIHLLSELLENATNFTAPDSPKVVLRAQRVTAGLAIEVQDRGLGMTFEDLQRINRLLDGSAEFDLSELLQDGRIGLAVVKELSRRHNVRVQLQSNIFGGVDAAVVLPHALLSDAPSEARPPQRSRLVTSEASGDAGDSAATAGQSNSRSATTMTAPAPTPSPRGRHRSGGAGPDADDHPSVWEQTGVLPGHQLPALPTRQPGTAFTPAASSSAAGADATESMPPPQQQERPPLPHRRGQSSHLRPELLEPQAPTTPLPGHNASLMATIRQGLDRGRDGRDGAIEPPQSQQAQSTEDSRHGG